VFPDNSTPITTVSAANRLTTLGYPNEFGVGITGYKRTATVFQLSSNLTSYNYPHLLRVEYNATPELRLYYRFYTGTTPSPAFDPFLDPATVPYYTLLQPGSSSYNAVTGVFTATNNFTTPYPTSASIGGTGVLRMEIVPSATSNPPLTVTNTPIAIALNSISATPTASVGNTAAGTTGTNALLDVDPTPINFNNITIASQVDGLYGFTQVLQLKDINSAAQWSIENYAALSGYTVYFKYSLTPFTITNTTHPGNQGFVRIVPSNYLTNVAVFTPSATYPAYTFPNNTSVTTNVVNGMYLAIAIIQDISLSGTTTLTIKNLAAGNATLDTLTVTWTAAFAGTNPNPGTLSFNNTTNTY
jgi:hypothetical protein